MNLIQIPELEKTSCYGCFYDGSNKKGSISCMCPTDKLCKKNMIWVDTDNPMKPVRQKDLCNDIDAISILDQCIDLLTQLKNKFGSL